MEADVIVEGLKKSMEMYGVKYHTFIEDADINESTMPRHTNHLMRNLRKKIRDLVTNKAFSILIKRITGIGVICYISKNVINL